MCVATGVNHVIIRANVVSGIRPSLSKDDDCLEEYRDLIVRCWMHSRMSGYILKVDHNHCSLHLSLVLDSTLYGIVRNCDNVCWNDQTVTMSDYQ